MTFNERLRVIAAAFAVMLLSAASAQASAPLQKTQVH